MMKMSKLDKFKGMDTEQIVLTQKMNALFYDEKPFEERKGLHASAIIKEKKDYCMREQVLSTLFKRNEAENVEIFLKRIFKQGDIIHEKWQDMFKQSGVAKDIEQRYYSKSLDLYLTPDAVINMLGRKYIVEIKSASTYSFQKMIDKHPLGTKQLQLYMHMLCIPKGFVLVEDKNNQDIKVFPVDYEPGQAKEALERLYSIKDAREEYKETGKLPKRHCQSRYCKEATRCPMSKACFKERRLEL